MTRQILGSKFSSKEWVTEIESGAIKVGMDGKIYWRDDLFIERLQRSIKYEKIGPWSYSNALELEALVDN